LRKAAALIRSTFKVDPYSLTDDKFAELFSEAIWLKKFDAELFENSIYSALGKAFGEQT